MSPKFEYEVCKQDIDGNGHMNNTIYAKIVQSTIDKFDKYNFFQINFVKETLLGQKILVYAKKENKKTTFVGKLKTGEVSFCAEVSD